MLLLKSEAIEYRGFTSIQSKKGNTYYYLNCENIDTGEAYKFFISDFDLIKSLEKGDAITLAGFYDFKYNQFRVTDIV